jgi:hypothetical protein
VAHVPMGDGSFLRKKGWTPEQVSILFCVPTPRITRRRV